MNETLTTYVAKSTMELKSTNTCLSFISTIWRNKPVLIMFNNISNSIVDTYFDPTYQEGDIEILEDLILNFLK